LNKPARAFVKDTLPAVDSHSEDEESWSSNLDTDPESAAEDRGFSDSDVEMPYESLPRQNHTSWDSDQDLGVEGLPIKLSNGQIQKTGVKFQIPRSDPDVSESEGDIQEQEDDTYKVEDISTGARFGRRSVVDVVSTASRKARIYGAKEQIASVCQDILSDPENSVITPFLTAY
jgi:nucleolar complex protein 3